MKKAFIYLFLFFSTSVFFAGCDKINDLNTVDFDASFSADLNCVSASLKSGAENYTFYGNDTIDPASDPTVQEYLNKIKKYEILSVKGTITSLSQQTITLVSADFDIFNSQQSATWSFQNQLVSVGTTLTLGNENGQWDTVSQILKNGQIFTVEASGESDTQSATFTIKIEIETKVTAEVL